MEYDKIPESNVQIVGASKKAQISTKPIPNQKQTSGTANSTSKILDSNQQATPNSSSKAVLNAKKLTALGKAIPNKSVLLSTPKSKDDPAPTQNASTPLANRYYNKVDKILAAIKLKREKDSQMLSSTQSKMDELGMKSYTKMEMAIFNFYKITENIMEEKMAQVLDISGKIAKLEEELEQVKGSVGILYQNFGKNFEQIAQDHKN